MSQASPGPGRRPRPSTYAARLRGQPRPPAAAPEPALAPAQRPPATTSRVAAPAPPRECTPPAPPRHGTLLVLFTLVLAGGGAGVVLADDEAPLRIRGPRVIATGLPIPVNGTGAPPGQPVELERRGPRGWHLVRRERADAEGRFMFRYRPAREARRYLLRVRVGGAASDQVRVRARDVTLAAAGDVNMGDGPGAVMAQRGSRWPWGGVASVLRRADIAAVNLECAVSSRGSPVPKEYNFRGRPGSLGAVRRVAGVDVVSLANNHAGDYGKRGLLDTIRHARRAGLVPVGAGRTRAAAISERIITALGLRVAFLGFSDIGPASFFAGPGSAGTAAASEGTVRFAVRRAARHADVVVPVFHWGVERQTTETARQRALAGAALGAGADVVIGAHPHVLQPIRRVGRRRVVAYSLGNFVWQSGSALTSRTGVLKLRLSARGVEGVRLLPAVIEGTRPRLVR